MRYLHAGCYGARNAANFVQVVDFPSFTHVCHQFASRPLVSSIVSISSFFSINNSLYLQEEICDCIV